MIAPMRRFRDLRDDAGLAPEVGRWFAALQDLRVGTLLRTHELDADQLAWNPAPNANSVGTLLTHVAESEAFWVVERIGGRPLPGTRRELYRMDLFGRPGAPQAPRAPASYFLGLLSDLRLETREVLAGLSDQDLEGKRVWSDPRRLDDQEVFTVRWILSHLFAHEAHHAGQIAMLRRLMGAPPAPVLADPSARRS